MRSPRGVGRSHGPSRRSGRLAGTFGLAAALIVTTAGCSNPDVSPSTGDAQTQQRTPTTTPAAPVGVIAIGHSGLTGENSDPNHPGQPAPENSWATGSSPEVDSVYQRLVVARPDTEGHVANTAVGGAGASSLAQQAKAALQSVPVPELVIVQTIDNDIKCDGTDAENVASFGDTLKSALESINEVSPESKILVVGQLGRPSPSFITELVAEDPSVKVDLTGSGTCDFYDEQGNLSKENFTALTKIIEAYEAEQARVCATLANCRTDGGVRAAYIDTLENFTDDWNHLNVAGQADAAKLIWPIVTEILGLN